MRWVLTGWPVKSPSCTMPCQKCKSAIKVLCERHPPGVGMVCCLANAIHLVWVWFAARTDLQHLLNAKLRGPLYCATAVGCVCSSHARNCQLIPRTGILVATVATLSLGMLCNGLSSCCACGCIFQFWYSQPRSEEKKKTTAHRGKKKVIGYIFI